MSSNTSDVNIWSYYYDGPHLFDQSGLLKTYVWAMNVVVPQVVLQSGLEYPCFIAFGISLTKNEGLSKIDLAKQMLLMMRESATCRLWVAMDRWYLRKDFFTFLEAHQFRLGY
ncbi:hypothetical protein HPL003_02145 [Paenibacillus terrae HPL-003]|uniref:Uncharacterized protein n=1 Tax=Paenibacillus terrae (strain HPL-003) TaxID=985665 RepID=G7VY32_PAETH|nr:hypothetical protein [Paenibacillus terrae]AET57210.1 hypothetical protein HPL003_02145 [Paenibacillus terrae HPL-003]